MPFTANRAEARGRAAEAASGKGATARAPGKGRASGGLPAPGAQRTKALGGGVSSRRRARALRRPPRRALRRGALAIGLAGALLALACVSLTLGSYDLSLSRILGVLWNTMRGVAPAAGDQALVVLLSIRLPRILLASLAGAALASAGAAYQGMFRNPLVSPDILGVSSGAAVGAALALLLGLPALAVHGISLFLGLAAVGLVLMIARAVGKASNTLVIMILAGVVMSSLFSAVLSLIKFVADPNNTLPQITYWLMGSFARSGNGANVLVMAFVLAVGGGALLAMRWRINALSFGEEEARTLGIDVKRTRAIVIAAATLLTSTTVCLCGAIGWVGLIIPHIMRLATGPNYRSLLPLSILGGACFMLLADNVARLIVPGELPVGVLTSLIGAPLFVYMLVKGRKEWL